MEARREVRKGRADGLDYADQLFTEACPHRQPIGRPHLEAGPQDKQIGDIGKNVFADFICPRPLPPFHVPAGAPQGGAVDAPDPPPV